jgi:hypothetical protein
MMTLNDTVALCKTFKRRVRGKTYYAYAAERATPGVCFDFQGEPYWGTTKKISVVYCQTSGPATIPPPGFSAIFEIGADSPERVQAHWESFLVNHGVLAPPTMSYVSFSNGPGREYRGKVVRTTKTRVLVSYKFGNGRQAANKWVKLNEISW